MKNFILVLGLLVLTFPNIFGKIRNGYEKDIPTLKLSLQSLREMLGGTKPLAPGQRRKIRENIRMLTSYLTYYETTEILLARFRSVSPDLYQEIDKLTDGKGRSIDIFVRFLPDNSPDLPSLGMVSLIPSPVDTVGCSSEYGEGTASVSVRVTNKAMQVLAHEFGHLSYIIPNLRAYADYYRNIYRVKQSIDELGHLCGDPSGRNAYKFEKEYRLDYTNYLKQDLPRETSPVALLPRTRRHILKPGSKGSAITTRITGIVRE